MFFVYKLLLLLLFTTTIIIVIIVIIVIIISPAPGRLGAGAPPPGAGAPPPGRSLYYNILYYAILVLQYTLLCYTYTTIYSTMLYALLEPSSAFRVEPIGSGGGPVGGIGWKPSGAARTSPGCRTPAATRRACGRHRAI